MVKVGHCSSLHLADEHRTRDLCCRYAIGVNLVPVTSQINVYNRFLILLWHETIYLIVNYLILA